MSKLISFESESEWLKWRLTGLGGSDAPVIMRKSRFKTPFELFLEKTGQKKAPKATEATKHGLNTEAKARDAYTTQTGNFMPPATLECELVDSSWLHASLDGHDPDNKLILEVKCPFDIGSFLTAKEGSVPDEYWDQIQHAMFVSEATKCHFWCYFNDDGVLLEVDFDRNYWEGELLPAEEIFWRHVQAKDYPLPSGKDDRSDDWKWQELEQKLYDALCMQQVANEKVRHFRAQIERMATAEVTTGKLLECIWNYRKGGFIPAYTRSPSLSMGVRRIK